MIFKLLLLLLLNFANSVFASEHATSNNQAFVEGIKLDVKISSLGKFSCSNARKLFISNGQVVLQSNEINKDFRFSLVGCVAVDSNNSPFYLLTIGRQKTREVLDQHLICLNDESYKLLSSDDFEKNVTYEVAILFDSLVGFAKKKD